MPPDLQIQTRSEVVDIPWLLHVLKSSYWGYHYTLNSLMRAVDHSLCFSAFIGAKQVGFCRVITDSAIVSMLTDVYVDVDFRRQGIGAAMMEAALTHRQVAGTICILQCRPENVALYTKFKFVPVGGIYKRDPQ